MAKRYDVFLSHSHDDRDFVARLAADLRSEGLTVWEDRWHVTTNSSIATALAQGGRAAHVVLLVLAPESESLLPVPKDRESAVDRQLHELLPRVVLLLRRDCELPPAFDSNRRVDFRDNASYEERRNDLFAVLESHFTFRAAAVNTRREQDIGIGVWIALVAVLLWLNGLDGPVSPLPSIALSLVGIAIVYQGLSRGWPAPLIGLAIVLAGGSTAGLVGWALEWEPWYAVMAAGVGFATPTALIATLVASARGRALSTRSLAFLAGYAALFLHLVSGISAFAAACSVDPCF